MFDIVSYHIRGHTRFFEGNTKRPIKARLILWCQQIIWFFVELTEWVSDCLTLSGQICSYIIESNENDDVRFVLDQDD
jgi:hypothetical protein